VGSALCQIMTKGRRSFILLMLGPAALLYIVFVLWPMAEAFRLSLYHWSGLSSSKVWVGFDNYRALATEQPPELLIGLTHNLRYLLVSALVVLPLALFFAVVLSAKTKAAGFYRSVYLFPNVISIVAVASLWYFIYDRDSGLLNGALKFVGLGALQRTWLGEPATALNAIIATGIWTSLGFYILLFSAGVQSIPPSFLEAAGLDGASSWQQFRHVTLPLVWEVFKLGVLYLIIHSLNVFGLVWVMNHNNANSDTDVLLTLLYQKGFVEYEFGRAAAVASVGFVVILGAILFAMRFLKRETVEY